MTVEVNHITVEDIQNCGMRPSVLYRIFRIVDTIGNVEVIYYGGA